MSGRDLMSEEIADQPALAGRLVGRLLGGLDGGLWDGLQLPEPRRLRFVARGTSRNAAAAAARVFREVADLPTDLSIESERGDRASADRSVLTIAMSQSGETVDVLNTIANVAGPVLAITNNDRSTLARRADAVLSCGAGDEQGLAATKTFTAQVLLGSAVALSLAAYRNGVTVSYWRFLRAFAETPDRLEQAQLLAAPMAEAVAAEMTEARGCLFMSRGAGLPYASEGALKLKQLTHRWAEVYPAGELKRFPIDLITNGTPVVVVDGGDRAKLEASIAAVQARGARVLRVGFPDDGRFPLSSGGSRPPWGPLESVMTLQYLALSLAFAHDCDTAAPRTLSKSVTVD
jgi:glucosamine--fructose-6-phosphate aminotransferase (isomerizing)